MEAEKKKIKYWTTQKSFEKSVIIDKNSDGEYQKFTFIDSSGMVIIVTENEWIFLGETRLISYGKDQLTIRDLLRNLHFPVNEFILAIKSNWKKLYTKPING